MTIEEENIQLVHEVIKEHVNRGVNDPTAVNGYARACGILHGILDGLVKDVPEAREYIIKYHSYYNKES
jgi:hypothetical protein